MLNYLLPFIILILIVVFISCNQDSKKQLPIYNPIDFNPKLVDKSIMNIHTVIKL